MKRRSKNVDHQVADYENSYYGEHVFGQPVTTHWVQTMRDKMSKPKTAGFDHEGTFLSRRMQQKERNASQLVLNQDRITVPDNIVNKVFQND